MHDVPGRGRRTLWLRVASSMAIALSAVTVHAQQAAALAPATSLPSAATQSRSSVPPLKRLVTLDLQDVPLATALRMIDREADLGLAFTSAVVPVDKRVSLRAKGIPAGEALKRVLEGTGVVVRKAPSGQLVLVKKEAEPPRSTAAVDTVQYAAVVVHVTDSASGKPLEGAVVTVKETTLTAATNALGFGLLRHVQSGLRVVSVRFLGYTSAERQIVVPDSGFVRVDIALHMGMTRLQDVVTTATGSQRRYELGNDITILDVDSIVATQPVSSVTDLLEGRVPGLTVQHTSGAPGDPSRLRLRGPSSVLRSNDPIVIVDGIRVYAAQSDSLSANLAARTNAGTFFGGTSMYAAPSPLDQLDPHSIEKIEVLKGPSAATLYGPDAANGVIVITTKKGHDGPPRWTMSASHGISYMPGKYPVGIYRWGHDYFGNTTLCPLAQPTCQADSVVRFQALNDDRYSVLGQGQKTNLTVGVSGGNDALTYALTGSYGDEAGILELPDVVAERYTQQHGGATPPKWMQRPQQLRQWSGTGALTARLGKSANVSISTRLTREKQQRSSLEQQIATLMSTYIDRATGTYWRGFIPAFTPVNELLPEFYGRVTDDATNFTNAASITWRPLSWFTTSADAGINMINRKDEMLTPRGAILSNADSIGTLNLATAGTVMSTMNVRATATTPLPLGFQLQLATGGNYTRTSTSALATGVEGLAPGTSSMNGAEELLFSHQDALDITSVGWYIEPSLKRRTFSISTGLRLDGSSTFGRNVHLPVFPKVNASWIVSEEPFFPLAKVFDVFRVRAAYGRAGVWPGPADQLRLFRTSRPWLDGEFQSITQISTIGNTQLEPEHTTELEGGFDADFSGGWLSIGFSAYRQTRDDALMRVPVAPSVYGNGNGGGIYMLRNVGIIRNTGFELTVDTRLLQTDALTWSTSFNFSRNRNVVAELGAGVLPFGLDDARVVAGYPLFGRWARPILGYADANGDGVIERDEVQLGDTLVYMGSSEPNYQANLSTTLSLFRGKITTSANFTYQDGITQIDLAAGGPGSAAIFSPGVSDPSSSLGEQAAVAVSSETSYGITQTVNTLRLNSISVAFNAPPSLAHRFGTRALSIALQGTNVGLWTNYSGKDPNVNSAPVGNSLMDGGALPTPRTWLLSIRTSF